MAFTGHLIKLPSTLLTMTRLFREGKSTGLGFGDSLAYAGVKASTAQIAFTGVLLAVMAIKLAFDAYNKSLVDHTKKAKEAVDKWEETESTLSKTKQTIEDIGSDFERLSKGVDSYGKNISLTADEFSKYNQIANQVAQMFPEMVIGYTKQGDAILSTKGNVKALTEAYKEQESAAKSASASSAGVVFEEFRRRTNKPDTLGMGDIPLERERDVISAIINAVTSSSRGTITEKDILREMSKAGTSENFSQAALKKVIEGTGMGQSAIVPGATEFKTTWLKENSRFLDSYMRSLSTQMESEANTIKPFIESVLFGDKNFKTLSDESKQIVSSIANELGYEYYSQFSNAIDASAGLVGDVLIPVESNAALVQSINSIEDARAGLLDGKKSVDAYTSSWANFEKQISDAGLEPVISDAIKSIYEVEGIDQLVTNVQGKILDEFDNKVGSMTLQDLRLASTLEVPEGILLTWDELRERISATKNILTSLTLTEQVAAIKTAAETANTAFEEGAYYGSISKEQYDKLAAAGDEYAATVDSTNGYLTVNKQKLDALIASKQEEARAQIAFNKAQSLADYEKNSIQLATQKDALDALALSTEYTAEEKEKYADILNKQNDALETSQEYLRAEIKAYDVLASELNYATSAYKRWLDAKNSPEAGDGYDELSVARKAIDEGLKSGKTGTNKYNAAEALLIPEEISAQGEKAVAKYIKSMGKYLTEDSTGLQKYINDLFGAGFLTKDADGTYFTTQKANIQDIAKELNITEEAARLMFAALKDYDWDISIPDSAFDSSAAITKFDEATAKWEEAKAYVEKLVKENASDAEIAAAKAAEAEAKRLQDEASVAVTQVDTGASLEEQLKAQIAAYQVAIAELGAIGVPATLLLNSENEAANLQTQLDAILAAQAIIAKATVELDDTALKEQLAALQSPTNPDGTAKTPIQIAIDAYLSDLYTAALAQVEEDKNQTGTVTIGGDTTGFDGKMSGIEGGTYGATVVIDGNTDPLDTKLTTVEERLATLQAKFDAADSNGDNPSLSTQYGGTGYQSSPEEILGYWEGANGESGAQLPKVEIPAELVFGTDGDSEVLLEDLGLPSGEVVVPVKLESQSNPSETIALFKKWAIEDIAKEKEKFANDEEGFKAYLEGKIAEITKRNEVFESSDTPLFASDLGALEAYKEVLDTLVVPKETPVTLKVDDAKRAADELETYIEGKKPNVVVTTTYEGRGNGFAKGTKRAKKGVALTGEEGVETVIDKDGFYTVGHGGPELVNLKGGEEILTHEETKKLLGRKGKRVSGQSFAGGTLGSVFDWAVTTANKIGEAVTKVIDPLISNVKKALGAGKDIGGNDGKGGKGGSGGKNSSSSRVTVDWIPRLLERLRRQTEKLIEQSEALVDYTAQNAELNKALNNNTKNITAAEKAYTKYMNKAKSVAKSGGLSQSIINKIQNGSINISSYSSETQKLIAEYQEWYDLAQDTLDTVTELKEQQKELALQKLDNVQKYYENRLGQSSGVVSLAESEIALKEETGQEVTAADYSDIISATSNQLDLLLEEKAAYEEEFNKLVANGTIKEGSDEWYEYTNNLNDMDVAINEASASLDDFRDIADNIEVKNLEIAMKYLNTVQSTLESLQGLREAQGDALTADDYENLISVGMRQIENLEAQNDVLREQQDGLDVLSDEYQEIQDKIDDNLSTVWDIKTEQEGWNDAIIDLDIEKLQEVNEEYDKQFRIMEAIENLEKARQRRNRVYVEGQGFVYQADQSAITAAQHEYDDVMFDHLIDTLEEQKDDNNIYDSNGNLIGTPNVTLDNVDLTNYLDGIDSVVESARALAAKMEVLADLVVPVVSRPPHNFTFGDIVLEGVNNTEEFAEALRTQLPSTITQLWFSNN